MAIKNILKIWDNIKETFYLFKTFSKAVKFFFVCIVSFVNILCYLQYVCKWDLFFVNSKMIMYTHYHITTPVIVVLFGLEKKYNLL